MLLYRACAWVRGEGEGLYITGDLACFGDSEDSAIAIAANDSESPSPSWSALCDSVFEALVIALFVGTNGIGSRIASIIGVERPPEVDVEGVVGKMMLEGREVGEDGVAGGECCSNEKTGGGVRGVPSDAARENPSHDMSFPGPVSGPNLRSALGVVVGEFDPFLTAFNSSRWISNIDVAGLVRGEARVRLDWEPIVELKSSIALKFPKDVKEGFEDVEDEDPE